MNNYKEKLDRLHESVFSEAVTKLSFSDEETTQDAADILKKNNVKFLINKKKSTILFNNDIDKKTAKMLLIKQGMNGISKQSLSPLDALHESVMSEGKEGKKYYVLTFRGRRLTGYHFNGFGGGMGTAFKFSNSSWLIYKTIKEAKDEIKIMKKDLKEWINNDVVEQAKNWSVDTKQGFLDESRKEYNTMLKNVNSFKIMELIGKESLSPLDALHESVFSEATKFKVGDTVRIDSGMGGSFDVKIKSISGNTYTGTIDNKSSSFHKKKRTFTDKDIKESLSPLDALYESVLKESTFLRKGSETAKVDRKGKVLYFKGHLQKGDDIYASEDIAVKKLLGRGWKVEREESLSPLDALHESVMSEAYKDEAEAKQ